MVKRAPSTKPDGRLPIIAFRVLPAIRRRTARVAKVRGVPVSAIARAALLQFLRAKGA